MLPGKEQCAAPGASEPGGVFACPGVSATATLNPNALLTGSQAGLYAGVSRQAIVNWRERGHLPVATDEDGREIRDDHGRPRYRLLDVAKAEHATSRAARRGAGGCGGHRGAALTAGHGREGAVGR